MKLVRYHKIFVIVDDNHPLSSDINAIDLEDNAVLVKNVAVNGSDVYTLSSCVHRYKINKVSKEQIGKFIKCKHSDYIYAPGSSVEQQYPKYECDCCYDVEHSSLKNMLEVSQIYGISDASEMWKMKKSSYYSNARFIIGNRFVFAALFDDKFVYESTTVGKKVLHSSFYLKQDESAVYLCAGACMGSYIVVTSSGRVLVIRTESMSIEELYDARNATRDVVTQVLDIDRELYFLLGDVLHRVKLLISFGTNDNTKPSEENINTTVEEIKSIGGLRV